MWLKALAIELVRVTKSATGSALPLARYFLSEADALPQDTSKLPPFSRALVLQIPTLADVKPGSLTRLLLPLLLTPIAQGEERLPSPLATTRFCRAHIEEPRGGNSLERQDTEFTRSFYSANKIETSGSTSAITVTTTVRFAYETVRSKRL